MFISQITMKFYDFRFDNFSNRFKGYNNLLVNEIFKLFRQESNKVYNYFVPLYEIFPSIQIA